MRTVWLAACMALASQAYAQSAERTGEQIVKAQCVKCHEAGVSGAPKIDDRAAWSQRMKNGLDATVRSATRGHGKMPARGGMADLTDAELRNAILYMFYPAGAALKSAPAAARAAPADPHHKSAGGMEIYLGIVLAQSAAVKQPKPSGSGYYHVNISLRDSSSNAPIKDAQVEARVSNQMGGDTRKLQLVTADDTPSYGNFFRMQGKDPYTIAVTIRRPGAPGTVETRFDFKP